MNKLLISNFKMNLKYDEIIEYKKNIENSDISNLIIAPSNIYLFSMLSDKYDMCIQDAYYLDSGSFTGEVSFNQAKSIGIKYSLIGHSERRKYFNETDDEVRRKLKACIDNEIIPILCVGEHKRDREMGVEREVVDSQLRLAIDNMKINKIIVAYEPVWAIGTGLIPNIDDIKRMHRHIKEVVNDYADNVKVVYGGGVNEENISCICEIEDVDGVLIGKESLKYEKMLNMYNLVKNM